MSITTQYQCLTRVAVYWLPQTRCRTIGCGQLAARQFAARSIRCRTIRCRDNWLRGQLAAGRFAAQTIGCREIRCQDNWLRKRRVDVDSVSTIVRWLSSFSPGYQKILISMIRSRFQSLLVALLHGLASNLDINYD